MSAVPVVHAGLVPCDASERREPSHAVSSFSRKSLPLHVALVIWRCNTSARAPRRAVSRVCALDQFVPSALSTLDEKEIKRRVFSV